MFFLIIQLFAKLSLISKSFWTDYLSLGLRLHGVHMHHMYYLLLTCTSIVCWNYDGFVYNDECEWIDFLLNMSLSCAGAFWGFLWRFCDRCMCVQRSKGSKSTENDMMQQEFKHMMWNEPVYGLELFLTSKFVRLKFF